MSEETVNHPVTAKKVNPQLESFKQFWRRLAKNKAAVVGGSMILFFIIMAFLGPWLITRFTDWAPNATSLTNKLQGPSAEHWFGTDSFGRDIFTRIVFGMKLTLYVGFLSVLVGGVVGVVLGIVSGYYGGKIDTIIMRLMDVLLAFPGILLALAIVAVLGGHVV